jgi:hypothetical protein
VLRRNGDDAGMITVHLFEQGWLWMIPLPEGIMSVGVVGDRPISSLGRTTSTESSRGRWRRAPALSIE